MSGGMPYYLEKGPVLTLIETYVNKSAAIKWDVLKKLQQAETSLPSSDWVNDVLPDLWRDHAFTKAAHTPLHIREHWFGYNADGTPWPSASSRTTGYWHGYKGDVNAIVLLALRYALQVAFEVTPGSNAATGTDPPTNNPAPVELFWVCATNWFEAWVVQRPGPTGGRVVSVVFTTPPHEGAEVAKSPIATAASTMPTTPGGHAVPSKELDYELVGTPPSALGLRPVAVERPYATWVVTHSQHVLTEMSVLANNSVGKDLGDTTPATFAVYEGLGDTVIISPSLPAGGVPFDHKVVVA
jgi:hypothetical protein